MNVEITKEIANCLYTGVSTDTGCFMYTNTSAKTHMIAAKLIECGADFAVINRAMFETKTKQKLALERMVYDTLDYYYDGKLAIIYTTLAMQDKLNLGDDQMEGLASIPRQIDGVKMGITIREKQDNVFKISVRTNGDTDACEFCKSSVVVATRLPQVVQLTVHLKVLSNSLLMQRKRYYNERCNCNKQANGLYFI